MLTEWANALGMGAAGTVLVNLAHCKLGLPTKVLMGAASHIMTPTARTTATFPSK